MTLTKHIPIVIVCAALLLSTASCEHQPVPTVAQAKEFQCMVKNIYYEARGDTEQGMQAVALVTLNRASKADKTICQVVYAPHQFSWTTGRVKPMTEHAYNNVAYVASQAMYGGLDDFTGGATYYHAKSVKPYWAKTLDKVGNIGAHIFYRTKT